MDPRSPFSKFQAPNKIAPSGRVFVIFCEVCHYVWKAPAPTTQCINCTNIDTAKCLVSYETEAPRI